jgi:hypothetical protein
MRLCIEASIILGISMKCVSYYVTAIFLAWKKEAILDLCWPNGPQNISGLSREKTEPG